MPSIVGSLLWIWLVASPIALAVFFIAALITGIISFRRGDHIDRERPHRWLLLLSPAVWIFMLLWTLFWQRIDGQPPRPDWVFYPVNSGILVAAALGFFLTWWFRGIRPFVTAFSLLNFQMAYAFQIIGHMAITGDWI